MFSWGARTVFLGAILMVGFLVLVENEEPKERFSRPANFWWFAGTGWRASGGARQKKMLFGAVQDKALDPTEYFLGGLLTTLPADWLRRPLFSQNGPCGSQTHRLTLWAGPLVLFFFLLFLPFDFVPTNHHQPAKSTKWVPRRSFPLLVRANNTKAECIAWFRVYWILFADCRGPLAW